MNKRIIKEEKHKTVLLNEVIDILDIQKGDVVVDATLGNGGHTLKMLEKVGFDGLVIGIDVDPLAINNFKNKIFNDYPHFKDRMVLVNDNFANIKNIIKDLRIRSECVGPILADLGWRIEQVRDKRYGMSFRIDSPLNMNFSGQKDGLTATEVVNYWSEEKLTNLFVELGEDNDGQKIAKKIVYYRQKKPIRTTTDLVEIIKEIKVNKKKDLHPATKIFQALRIVVNKELSNLDIFLKESWNVLKNEKRLGVITFHSLEDRLVKNFFRAKARGCVCPKELPVCACSGRREGRVVGPKIIKPSEEEIKTNKRSRSAKLRVMEKIKI